MIRSLLGARGPVRTVWRPVLGTRWNGAPMTPVSLELRRYFADSAGDEGFVARMKKRMVKSFEDTKKVVTEKAADETEKLMINFLKSTPRGQLDMNTLTAFYTKLKEDQEAKADNFIASRMEEYQQGLEQLKRCIKMLNSLDPVKRANPKLITNGDIVGVAERNNVNLSEATFFFQGCHNLIRLHEYVTKPRRRKLQIPDSLKKLQTMMEESYLTDDVARNRRTPAGYFRYFYESKGVKQPLDSRRRKPAQQIPATYQKV